MHAHKVDNGLMTTENFAYINFDTRTSILVSAANGTRVSGLRVGGG